MLTTWAWVSSKYLQMWMSPKSVVTFSHSLLEWDRASEKQFPWQRMFAKGQNQTNLFLIIYYWRKLIRQQHEKKVSRKTPKKCEWWGKKANDIAQTLGERRERKKGKSLNESLRLQSFAQPQKLRKQKALIQHKLMISGFCFLIIFIASRIPSSTVYLQSRICLNQLLRLSLKSSKW
jgi:hypothetical protein